METTQISTLRYAIIGAGAGVLGMHRPALQLPSIEVVAVSDVVPEAARQRAEEWGCPSFTDHRQLLSEIHPDVAVVMTPHPFHAQIAIDCLQAGCHVLVEKPMAVHVGEADAMVEAADKARRLLGVVFQHRFRPEIRAAYQLLQEGRIGRVQHVTMSAVWTRTARYYQSAGWRGTWKGEGGGVLMNQAPHHLDLLCHLVGRPARVFSWTRRVLHSIETEDTVEAALEWPGGALGSLHISTAEADQAEYLKIVGTRGQLELNGGKLSARILEEDIADFVATSPKPMAAPGSQELPITLDTATAGKHADVYQAFNAAIQHGIPFTSAGAQGIMALELANACIYSNYTHSAVELPLDRQKYITLLADLIDKNIQ